MKIWKIARRNVVRNRRRSVVTVAAMSLALVVLLLYAGLMEGYLRAMEANVVDLEVGDVQIFAALYRNDPSLYHTIERPDVLLDALGSEGLSASGRLLGFGLASAGDASAGASFRGIDVVVDAQVSRVHEELEEGAWLEPDDVRGVVVGRRLARMLGVAPGSELLVLSQGADGSMAYDLYTVRGVLRGIGDATDRTGVFMTADAFRELMVVPTGVHQIIVRRPTGVDLDEAAARAAGHAPQSDVQTWRQLLPTLASMLDSARSIIYVMFVIVYLAVAILILNAMLMAVFERVREFGVLKAVGATPSEVAALIVAESVILCGSAIGIGLALGLPGLWYLTRFGFDLASLAGVSIMGVAMNSIWRAAVTPAVLLGPILTLIAIVTVAIVPPALKAARIQPVEAMRYR